jgi:hypothetical protein
MSDEKTVSTAPSSTREGNLAERDPEPAQGGALCPESCRNCRMACPESALIGRTVVQAQCRRRAGGPDEHGLAEPGRAASGRAVAGFSLPGCPICRETRTPPPGKPKVAWRKSFLG